MIPIAIALAVQAAHDPRCDSPRTPDLMACAGAEWQRADAAMNAEYRRVMAQMKAADAHPQPDATIGPGYAAVLLASQRAWLAFRDAECVNQGYKYRGGTMQNLDEVSCKAHLTEARTKQIHDLTVTP